MNQTTKSLIGFVLFCVQTQTTVLLFSAYNVYLAFVIVVLGEHILTLTIYFFL